MQGSFWVKGLRIFSYIIFFVIVIGGFVFGVSIGYDSSGFIGFLVIVAGLVTAFLAVAMIMVFLDIAADLSVIRGMIKEQLDLTRKTFVSQTAPTQPVAKPSTATAIKNVGADGLATQSLTPSASQSDALIRRAFLLLEEGGWDKADEVFEQALNVEPENSVAYIGKLCVELRLNREADLLNYELPIRDYSNYKRALQFADEKYKVTLDLYAQTPEDRIALEERESTAQGEKILRRVDYVKTSRDPKEFTALVMDLQAYGADGRDLAQALNEWSKTTSWTPIRWSTGDRVNCPLCNTTQDGSSRYCVKCGIEFSTS